jgi:arylsulfatase A-like enzyme
MVRLFDATCGEIIDFLETRGLRENTLLFVLSDNGNLIYQSKGHFPENGYRTPSWWPARVWYQARPVRKWRTPSTCSLPC